MTIYRNERDRTMQQGAQGGGMDLRVQFVDCGHKGLQAGGEFKQAYRMGRVAWRCAACVKGAA